MRGIASLACGGVRLARSGRAHIRSAPLEELRSRPSRRSADPDKEEEKVATVKRYEVDPTMTALDFGRAKSLEPAELREANVAIVDSSLRCFPGTSRSVETCS